MSIESVISRSISEFLTTFDIHPATAPLLLRIEPFNVSVHELFYHVYIVKYFPVTQFFRVEYRKGEKTYTTLRSPSDATITILDSYNQSISSHPDCERIQIQVAPEGIVDLLVEMLIGHSYKYGWHPTTTGVGLKCAILKDEKESFVLEPLKTLTGIAALSFPVGTDLPTAFASEIRRRINIIKSIEKVSTS